MLDTNVDLELILNDEVDPNDDEYCHGVHMECQYNKEQPIAACGKVMTSWLGYTESSDYPKCSGCYPDHGLVICPVCFVSLSKE